MNSMDRWENSAQCYVFFLCQSCKCSDHTKIISSALWFSGMNNIERYQHYRVTQWDIASVNKVNGGSLPENHRGGRRGGAQWWACLKGALLWVLWMPDFMRCLICSDCVWLQCSDCLPGFVFATLCGVLAWLIEVWKRTKGGESL